MTLAVSGYHIKRIIARRYSRGFPIINDFNRYDPYASALVSQAVQVQ